MLLQAVPLGRDGGAPEENPVGESPVGEAGGSILVRLPCFFAVDGLGAQGAEAGAGIDCPSCPTA